MTDMEIWIAQIVFFSFAAVVGVLVITIFSLNEKARRSDTAASIEADAIRGHLMDDLRLKDREELHEKLKVQDRIKVVK